MPLILDESCRGRILEILPAQLEKVCVVHGNTIDYESVSGLSACDKALPSTGRLADSIRAVLGDRPLSTFIESEIGEELATKHVYTSESSPTALVTTDGFNDPGLTAEALITGFESLPWRYTLMTPLFLSANGSIPLNAGTQSLQLSGGLDLLAPSEEIRRTHPLPEEPSFLAGLTGEFTHSEWLDGRLYLRLESDGYVPRFGNSALVDSFKSSTRSILGLGMALVLFENSLSHFGPPLRHAILTYRNSASSVLPRRSQYFSTAESELIASINTVNIPELPDRVQARWMSEGTTILVDVMSNRKKHKNVVKAAEWFFESHCGSNETLSFVQLMICLEILLGDKARSDRVGIGELLANRVAYMLGESEPERAQLLERVRALYDTRSKIVHSGARSLDIKGRAALHELKRIVARVIRREIQLAGSERTP